MTDASPVVSVSDSLLLEALPDLTLNIAQTAALCGISVRQLGYWTRQGYVAAQGQGARRTYGIEAIQRVLAIRKTMTAGASLRQALRRVASEAPPQMPPVVSLRPETVLYDTTPLPPSQAAAVSRSLIEFFEMNSHTRDHAGGLAVKLGWTEEDVRVVADSLCASGILAQNICQGMPVFHRAAWGATYA